jgi:polygalacturonase
MATSRSVTVELCNDHPWCAPEMHRVWLDGRLIKETNKNVFTLHGLESDSFFTLLIESGPGQSELTFHTAPERCNVDVRAFGAVGDGIHDDTAAIQAALSTCPAGGVVEFSAGDWLTSPLFLKSAVNLYLARGARLIGHPDIDRWPVLPGLIGGSGEKVANWVGSWEGQPTDCHAALINAIGVHDVQIHGDGVIDGNASFETWWKRPKQPFRGWRPRTVYLVRSKRIGICGVGLRNSPSWTIHAFFSESLCFADLTIESPYRSPNTDGIVPECCEEVRIVGTRISTGDDCVAIKSGKAWLASQGPCASRHVRISNCLMERGHGAVVVGSEMSGGVYDVTIRDCLFRGTDRGLRIKTRRGRGKTAIVEGVRLDNVRMERVGTPLAINSFYFCDPDGRTTNVADRRPLPIDEGTPTLRDISLSDVSCEDVAHCAGLVLGLPELPIEKLSIKRYRVRFDPEAEPGFPDRAESIEAVARAGLYLCNVRELVLDALDIEGSEGPSVTRENALEINETPGV